MIRPRFVLLLVAVVAVFTWVRWPRTLRTALQRASAPQVSQRLAAIESELAVTSRRPAWAGRYYSGDGLGENVSLHLAPRTGCAVVWEGCLGLYGQNEGEVVAEGPYVRLVLEQPNEPGEFGAFWDDLVFVPWGERSYLIPRPMLVAFAEDVREGLEPRDDMHGDYPLRLGDEALPVSGRPLLPPALAAVWDAPPIRPRVVEIVSHTPPQDSHGYGRSVVRLDTGSAAGLYLGMKLELADGEDSAWRATVAELSEHEALAEALVSEGEPSPDVGALLRPWCAAWRRRAR